MFDFGTKQMQQQHTHTHTHLQIMTFQTVWQLEHPAGQAGELREVLKQQFPALC